MNVHKDNMVKLTAGLWYTVCLPEDGARLHELQYNNVPLLTQQPAEFKPPDQDYGAYEQRPVYGYDDCFPTVDQCRHPVNGQDLPDHGELCWLPWQVAVNGTALTAEAELPHYSLLFSRKMLFQEKSLTWRFSVRNRSRNPFHFLHVMHPLAPLDQVKEITLPECGEIFDEAIERKSSLTNAGEAADYLLKPAMDREYMLLLSNITEGRVSWTYAHGIRIQAHFPLNLFPNLGIWWNCSAYPAEAGKQRNECAFEPLAGSRSNLELSFQDNCCLTAPAEDTISWDVVWEVNT